MKTGRWNRNLALRLACLASLLGGAANGAVKYKVLHNFTGGADGNGNSGVTLDDKGRVFGPSLGGGDSGGNGLIFQLVPRGDGRREEDVLYTFQGEPDGEGPSGALALDPSGNIYGTTQYGGVYGWGTVYELTHSDSGWTDEVLYSFPFCEPQGCGDGRIPTTGVVMDPSGNLYGTAGGSAFELSPGSDGWNETVLHVFTGNNGDGAAPGAIIRDNRGDLYGATQGGGNRCGNTSTCGTVYELSPRSSGKWKETILHRFDNNGKDGITPGIGALYMDRVGNLYGTTETGNCCGGVVYKLTPRSNGKWKETIIYAFKGGASGNQPYAGVVMDKSGNLYGTTDGGGGGCGCGVIYRLAPRSNGPWKYTVLHSFAGSDGATPAGNLAIDEHGNLYGGTIGGGKYGRGVVFELTP